MPTFKDDDRKDAALHLVRFHMHVCKLKIYFPKDFSMKMFMATLEGKARSWYEGLPEGNLCSLKYFHRMFSKNYVKYNLSLSHLQSCCDYSEGFISYLQGIDDI